MALHLGVGLGSLADLAADDRSNADGQTDKEGDHRQ